MKKKYKCEKCNSPCYGKLCKPCWKIYTFPRIKKGLIKSNTGRVAWNKGISPTLHTRDKISNKLKGKNIGKMNGLWKGNKVKYNALHAWIKRHKPKPKFCEDCGSKEPFDLANISGEYKRDINDFKWVCRGCHMKEDGRMNNLKVGGQYANS